MNFRKWEISKVSFGQFFAKKRFQRNGEQAAFKIFQDMHDAMRLGGLEIQNEIFHAFLNEC